MAPATWCRLLTLNAKTWATNPVQDSQNCPRVCGWWGTWAAWSQGFATATLSRRLERYRADLESTKRYAYIKNVFCVNQNQTHYEILMITCIRSQLFFSTFRVCSTPQYAVWHRGEEESDWERKAVNFSLWLAEVYWTFPECLALNVAVSISSSI